MSLCRAIDLFGIVSGSYGSAGMCPADGVNFSTSQKAELLLAFNQSLPMLMKRLDAKGTLARWVVPVCGGVFTLPADCLDVRQAFLNGCELNLRDQWYEGQIGHKLYQGSCCHGPDLIDMGDGFAIPEEWPSQHHDVRYGLMAEDDEDAGKTVQVKLLDDYGNVQEEVLELLKDQQLVLTDSPVTDIRYQYKGVTRGAVVGFISYPQGQKVRIARYAANVATPTYHKKKLPASFGCCSGELSILGKMRFTPLQSETDTLPICDGMALSFGFQALHYLRERNLEGYNAALTFAVSELEKEMRDTQPAGVVSQMRTTSPFRNVRRCWS